MCDLTHSQEFSPEQAMSFYGYVLESLVECYEEKGATADVREVADVVRRQLRLEEVPFDWSEEQKVLAQAMRRSEFRTSLQMAYLLATIKTERSELVQSWGQVERLLEGISQGARVDTEELRLFTELFQRYTKRTEQELPMLMAELRMCLRQPEAVFAARRRGAALAAA